METIKINGKEHNINLYVLECQKILLKYNYTFSKLKTEFEKKNNRPIEWETDRINISDEFFYRAIYRLLVKKYPWPFRKPYRSMKQMVNHTTIEEAEAMVNYIWYKVLYRKLPKDEPATKTKKKD